MEFVEKSSVIQYIKFVLQVLTGDNLGNIGRYKLDGFRVLVLTAKSNREKEGVF